MNTRELIDIVKKDGPMFVLESYKGNEQDKVYYIDHIFNENGDVYEKTLFFKCYNEPWQHYDLEPMFLLITERRHTYIGYEPINLDEFITEHFAELL